MKKKVLKVVAFCVAILLIFGVALFANGLLGNPISKAIAEKNAAEYLAEAYSGQDLEIRNVVFGIKSGYYEVYVVSPYSEDTQFTLSYNWVGKLVDDDYAYRVLGGWNTAMRIESLC